MDVPVEGPTDGAVVDLPGIRDLIPIATGGTAAVYHGIQKRVLRSVAVKVLAHRFGDTDRDRFVDEAQTLARVPRHPGIVYLIDLGWSAHDTEGDVRGLPFLVMEHLDGGSLADRLAADGPLPWLDAARVGAHLAEAVAHAHRSRVFHRDIKPANVMFHRDDPHPVLIDFGFSTTLRWARLGDEVWGSSGFVPPEVLEVAAAARRSGNEAFRRDVDLTAWDVYSLGITIGLALGIPFDHFAPGRDRSELGADVADDVPTEVLEVLAATTADDPGRRPGHVADVGAALRQVVRDHDPFDQTRPRVPVRRRAPGDGAPGASRDLKYANLARLGPLKPVFTRTTHHPHRGAVDAVLNQLRSRFVASREDTFPIDGDVPEEDRFPRGAYDVVYWVLGSMAGDATDHDGRKGNFVRLRATPGKGEGWKITPTIVPSPTRVHPFAPRATAPHPHPNWSQSPLKRAHGTRQGGVALSGTAYESRTEAERDLDSLSRRYPKAAGGWGHWDPARPEERHFSILVFEGRHASPTTPQVLLRVEPVTTDEDETRWMIVFRYAGG